MSISQILKKKTNEEILESMLNAEKKRYVYWFFSALRWGKIKLFFKFLNTPKGE